MNLVRAKTVGVGRPAARALDPRRHGRPVRPQVMRPGGAAGHKDSERSDSQFHGSNHAWRRDDREALSDSAAPRLSVGLRGRVGARDFDVLTV